MVSPLASSTTAWAAIGRRAPVVAALVVVGYALGSLLSYHWFRASGAGDGDASFFPAAGVTLAALLLVSRRLWPVVLVSAAATEIVVDLAQGISIAGSVGYALANTVQPLAGALLIQTVTARPDLARSRDLATFIGGGVLVSPVIGAVIGATTFTAVQGGEGWLRFAAQWWVGDGLGVLVVGGAVLSLTASAGRALGRVRRLEAAGLIGATVGATIGVFWFGAVGLVFVPVALLLVIGFRVGTRGVALTGAVVALLAAQATAQGDSIWGSLDVSTDLALLYLQAALGVLIATALAVAAQISEREDTAIRWATAEAERREAERASVELRESEARFRALFSAIDEGYCLCEMVIGPDGRPADYRFLEVNPVFEEMTGLADPVGHTALELVPGLERSWVDAYGEVALDGKTLRFQQGSEVMGRFFDVFATPVEPRGRFALVFTDITHQRREEAERSAREEAERRARRDAELLADVVGEMESAQGVADRAGRLVALMVPEVAEHARVELRGEDGAVLASAGAADPPGAARWNGDGGIEEPLDLGAGTRATLVLRGGRRGAAFTDEDRALAAAVAGHAELLLASARLQEEEREIALRLQRALLPEQVHRDPRAELAVRYVAAGKLLEVGGDWYDAFALPGDRIGLSVGDVVGHGLEAAAAMGRLRTALAALAPHADGPGEALSRLHDYAKGPDGAPFATACYAVLDPASGELVYSSAGHPPMLVLGTDGEVRWLEGGRAVPLCRLDPGRRPEARTVLEPGALLVLYSDGLVERRAESLTRGLERLAQAVRQAADAPADEVCERLVAAMTPPGGPADDAIVVCLRYRPAA